MMETLSSWIFGQQLGDYNLEELTAELFYAEANLLLSFLTFVQVSPVSVDFCFMSTFHSGWS